MVIPIQPAPYARLSVAVKWLLTLTVVLLTGLEILDGTIISVSIRSMQGALAATKDQLSWMMTGYMITSAIVVLMSGCLTKLFGRRRLILLCVVAFGVFSMLCGVAATPIQVIVCRMAQGAFGGLLAPMAQSTLNDLHDQKSRPFANALYGIGLMTAPVMGPLLGGVITDTLGWRWDFFINIPVSVTALVLIALLMPKDQRDQQRPYFDSVGFFLIVVGVGCLQYVLDNGTGKGWFTSNVIVITSLLSCAAIIISLFRGLAIKEKNIINFSVMANLPFVRAMLVLFVFCVGFAGTVAWMPNYMESYLGFTATQAGMSVAPRGIASAVAMLFVPGLLRMVAVRWLLFLSFVLYAASSYLLIHINLTVDASFFQVANIVQGVSMGFFFVPMVQEAFRTMPTHFRDSASGLFNFFRTIGFSMGVAVFSSVVNHESHVNSLRLSEKITPSNPIYQQWLHAQGLTSAKSPDAISRVAAEIGRQAGAIAFADAFYYVMILFVVMLPVVLVMRWGSLKNYRERFKR